ncbi:MAG: HAD family hydrolase [Candidatus Bathyarchaeia archaeon]
MHIVALAFDFDGTLVDVSKPYSMAFNETLKRFGLPPTDPILLYVNGAYTLKAQFCQVISLSKANEEILLQKCLEMYLDIYMKIHLKYLKKFKNALQAVRVLDKKGFKLALIGGRPKFQVEPELEFIGIRDYFDIVLTSEDVTNPKPAPDIVQRTAELLGISTEKILVVGDSPEDILAAKRAGAYAAGVCSGYFSKEIIEKVKPDIILDSAASVLDIVANCSEHIEDKTIRNKT